MNIEDYKKMVKEFSPQENRLKNILVSFFVGGLIGFLGEFFIYFVTECFGTSQVEASMWLCLFLIVVGTFLTALGFFDTWFSKLKCGLIIPTTGFAHSVASCALDFKKEGLITGLGANFFRLAGSVILYGILSAFFLCVIKVMLIG